MVSMLVSTKYWTRLIVCFFFERMIGMFRVYKFKCQHYKSSAMISVKYSLNSQIRNWKARKSLYHSKIYLLRTIDGLNLFAKLDRYFIVILFFLEQRMAMKNSVVHHRYRRVRRLHLVLVLCHQRRVAFVNKTHTCKRQVPVDLSFFPCFAQLCLKNRNKKTSPFSHILVLYSISLSTKTFSIISNKPSIVRRCLSRKKKKQTPLIFSCLFVVFFHH